MSSDLTRRPPSWASRSITWRVLAGIRLTVADTWDELGNYTKGSAPFPSQRLRKPRAIRPTSGASTSPNVCDPYTRTTPESTGPAASPYGRHRLRHGRRSRGWSCPLAAAAQGVIEVKWLLPAMSGSRVDTAVAATNRKSCGRAAPCGSSITRHSQIDGVVRLPACRPMMSLVGAIVP